MSYPSTSVLLLGSTGTIGQAVADALASAGHTVVAPVRSPAGLAGRQGAVLCDMTETALTRLMQDHACTAVISCLASRDGSPKDAQAVDYALNRAALDAAQRAGLRQFVLLSAICVQKPKLAFQHAKRAFEADLQAADLTWSIVRPTAYFKSLSGQIDRLRAGKPFLLFGDGRLTACKPISNRDLARFIVNCLADPALHNRILPIGGPGPALTPRAQGEQLFAALGQTPRFKTVPVAVMSAVIALLSALGKLSPRLRDKAEFARIGRYYATESMLVWDAKAGRYDPDATPEFGTDTLADHYRRLAATDKSDNLGAHAVF